MQDWGISVLFEGRNFIRLLEGLGVTLEISLLSVLVSMILGTGMGVLMSMNSKVIRFICRIYLNIVRIIPQLVLLFLAYFGLSKSFGVNLSGELAAVLVFSFWGIAEMGDLVRGALNSIPKHQYETGLAVGLSRRQLYQYIIIPQTIRRLLPQTINLITRIIKTTSLIVLIGVVEVVKVGQQIIEASRLTVPSAALWIYGVIFYSLFYHLLSNFIISDEIREMVGGVEKMLSETILKLNHVTKRYDENVIFSDLSFEVKKGEVVVILGPSGCGKSTLLRCINGLEQIQEGDILLEDERISYESHKMSLIRQKIGMVFQSYELFPHMDVLHNILLGPTKAQGRNKEEVMKEAEQLLARVGLLDKKKAYPRQLSGGQKQRVAIVRALCMKPEILLFDEITAALDPEMVREVLDVVLSLAKEGSTMVIVTHEMEFARAIADRIIFLDEGKIVEESDPETFFTNPKTKRAQQFLNLFKFE